ncbi:MAG: hypothetical protein NVSMB17_09810 [Candidatus Dormibacteria bacterium]
MLGAALLRVFLALTTPPLFAADEAGHLLYIHEIAIHHVLPTQTLDGIWANNNGTEDFYHMPIYYLLLAPLYRLLWPAHIALYALRFTSVGLGLVTIVLIRGVVRDHFSEHAWVPELSAFFAAFLPVFVAVTSAVNIDALALLLMVVVLQLVARLLRDGVNASRIVLLSLVLVVAIYVKVSILGLFPVFAIAVFLVPASRPWTRLLMLVPPAASLLAVLPWLLLRNQRAYGSLLALDMHWQVLVGPLWFRVFGQTLYMCQTFWFGLGRTTEILNPLWIAIPLSGMLYIFGRRTSVFWRSLPGAQRAVLFILLVPFVTGYAQSIDYGVRWGYSQGRYLLPGLTGLSLIFGLGIVQAADLHSMRRRAQATAIFTTAAWLLFLGIMVLPGFSRVKMVRAVGGATAQKAFETGDLDTWVLRRAAPIRAEDGCASVTHSPYSRHC